MTEDTARRPPRRLRAGDEDRAPQPDPRSPAVNSGLLDVDAGDRAGNDQALDLGGALEDGVDLGVAVHPLDRELAGVAVAAEDLDRPLGRPDGDLSGLQLRHRALGALEFLAGAT